MRFLKHYVCTDLSTGGSQRLPKAPSVLPELHESFRGSQKCLEAPRRLPEDPRGSHRLQEALKGFQSVPEPTSRRPPEASRGSHH